MKSKVASIMLLGSVALAMAPAHANASVISDRPAASLGNLVSDSGTEAEAGGDQLTLASDEQYVQTFGAARAAQQGLTYEAVAASDSVEDSGAADDTNRAIAAEDSVGADQDAGSADDEAAAGHWSVVRFVAHDAEGRYIPTRQGNRELGWAHFSGRHNIHSEKVIKAAVNEHPESGSNRHRKVYGAVLFDRLGIILARVEVIAQYHWETADHRWKLADPDDKIGVITAYCKGVNKCPDALNHV
ncbi:hypothetical protein [Streptomyces aureus]|uniref:hypothetical protein n=1 Tax=Streptomyces aureus TaxID=193461 RepID=UPI0036B859B5